MATADRSSHRRSVVISALAVVLLTAAVFALTRPDAPEREQSSAPEPVEVESSSRHQFTDLAQLLAASDLVVSGRVVAVEPGRVFGAVDTGGDASGEAIRSRVATLEVDAVLASTDPAASPAAGTVVLVEEEGTLLDGAPLVVDGVRPTRVGDDGIWFLAAALDPEFPGFVVVNSQGRYLRRGSTDVIRGSDRTDELVQMIEELGASDLLRAIAAATAPR